MKSYAQNKGFNAQLNEFRTKQVLKHIKGNTCLEIGFGEGHMTKHLVKHFKEVVCIDCDENHYNNLPLYKNVLKIHGKFEKYNFGKFDFIVCTNVLEHIKDTKKFLERLKLCCHKKTRVFLSVPNARSINRILGTEIGMIKNVKSLDKQDKEVGHKHMFNIYDLEILLLTSDFKILKKGSYLYKPFPNHIMLKLPKNIVNKCISYNMKNYGAEIYTLLQLSWG